MGISTAMLVYAKFETCIFEIKIAITKCVVYESSSPVQWSSPVVQSSHPIRFNGEYAKVWNLQQRIYCTTESIKVRLCLDIPTKLVLYSYSYEYNYWNHITIDVLELANVTLDHLVSCHVPWVKGSLVLSLFGWWYAHESVTFHHTISIGSGWISDINYQVTHYQFSFPIIIATPTWVWL